MSERNLLRGAYLAFHKPNAESLARIKIYTKSIYNPCSGKHATQLTLCQYYGWRIILMKKWAHLFQTLNLEKYKNNGENFQPTFFPPGNMVLLYLI